MLTYQIAILIIVIVALLVQSLRSVIKLNDTKALLEAANSGLLMAKAEAAKLARVPAVQSRLTSVKFHARVPSYSGFHKTEFKLGLDPCGLTVETVLFEEQPEKFVLTQIYTNGERKTFDYYKKDIQGRIEKRWAA